MRRVEEPGSPMTRSAPLVRESSPVAGLRRRRLGFVPVLAQSVSAVAPTAAMATSPAFTLEKAGAFTLPVIGLAVVLVLLVAHCVTQFSRRMAGVGGLYSYVAKGLGPVPALVSAVSAVIGYAAVAMAALLGAGLYLTSMGSRLWPGLSTASSGSAPSPGRWAVLGVVLLVATGAGVLMVRGIRLSAWVTLVVEIVSITVIVAVLAVTAAAVTSAGWSSLGWTAMRGQYGTPAPPSVALGAVLALSAFIGFESASTLGSEAQRPFVSVSRAVRWTPVLGGVLFTAAAVVQVAGSKGEAGLLSGPVPLLDLAAHHGLGGLAPLLDFAVATSFLACALASTNALVRVMFTLSREGLLPRGLGVTHPRFATPHRALLLAVPLLAAVPAAMLAAGDDPRHVLAALLVLSCFGSLGSYVLVCVAAPLFLRRIGEWSTATLVAGGTATVLMLTVAWTALAGGLGIGTPGVVYCALLVAGTAAIAVLRLRRDTRLDDVGLYDEATRADLWDAAARVER